MELYLKGENFKSSLYLYSLDSNAHFEILYDNEGIILRFYIGKSPAAIGCFAISREQKTLLIQILRELQEKLPNIIKELKRGKLTRRLR